MYERMKVWLDKALPGGSPAFVGMGTLLAWIALLQSMAQTNDRVVFGTVTLAVDLGSAPIFLLFLTLARRLTPLMKKRVPLIASAVAMLIANVIIAVTYATPDTPKPLVVAGLVIAGAGSAAPLLYWWEIYGVLNPIKVAAYYAGSWVLREVLVLALIGYTGAHLIIATFVLPLVALLMLSASTARLRRESLVPRVAYGTTSFPWKPMVLVALYAFAYGCGTWLLFYKDDVFMHVGILLPALIVCASVLFASKHFNFTLVYRVILPVAIAGLLALLVVQPATIGVVTIFVRASYAAVFIYVSVLLCNLSRRYSISAVWLFSLFNITHIAFLGMGTLLFNALPSLAILGVCIVCVVFVTFIIISEPSLDSNWRIVLTSKGSDLGEQARVQLVVDALAQKHGLSARQSEILLLLAQGNLPRSIGHTLSISPGTVKAHIQHIYKKLGIHSKEELDALVRE